MTPERAKRFAISPLAQVASVVTTTVATQQFFGQALITLIVASAFIIFFVANAIRYMLYWRCHDCETRLPVPNNTKNDFVYCPHCGADLNKAYAKKIKLEEI